MDEHRRIDPLKARRLDAWLEAGRIPDGLIRLGARLVSRKRLNRLKRLDIEQHREDFMQFVGERSHGPIAVHTEDANKQHYEMPAAFFSHILGPRMKYSCALWTPGVRSLDQAEDAMLACYEERAGLADGQRVLELGCGWGALSLHVAERYPASRVTAVSGSASQRAWIEARARERGLDNLDVITCDINDLMLDERYDRILSVEMFEHMRNYQALFNRLATWLTPGGRLFLHVFCHRSMPFVYETTGRFDWMARAFFTGGTMPSRDLFHYFAKDLRLVDEWAVSGRHYQQTLEAWLRRMDASEDAIRTTLHENVPEAQVGRLWNRWRIFFLACSEFFGLAGGNEYFVVHQLFERSKKEETS